VLADRPQASLPSWEAFSAFARQPSGYYRRLLFNAREGRRVVGTGQVGLSDQDNQHLASLDIAVLPEFRRRGTGSALYVAIEAEVRQQGRNTLLIEAADLDDVDAVGGGMAFARSLGFRVVNSEDHLWCALPLATERRADLDNLVAQAAGGYEIVSWVDRCPPEYVATYCELHTQMAKDVPVGGIDLQPVVYDETRLRSQEERMRLGYIQVVSAARRRAGGVFGGYSAVVLDRAGQHVHQNDTLVMPGHRGHRLGLRLKLANLDIVQRDYPGRTGIHTWTAVDNEPMQRTNRRFGFVPIAREHQLQRSLS
jgi:GNAT superfamily N-acetyltransferase